MNTTYHVLYVLLSDGSLKHIHGKLLPFTDASLRRQYGCSGYVYVKGQRVYGTARNWSYVNGCFTFFEPRGKWAHLADPVTA